MKILKTSDSELKIRNGQTLEIIRKIEEPDKTHDLEVLPMTVVKFKDGYQTELWDDEIIENEL